MLISICEIGARENMKLLKISECLLELESNYNISDYYEVLYEGVNHLISMGRDCKCSFFY